MRGVSRPGRRRVDRVYTGVRQRIIEGRYRPGTFLSESMLGRLYGREWTPVREARGSPKAVAGESNGEPHFRELEPARRVAAAG